jgi:hypothetical protein
MKLVSIKNTITFYEHMNRAQETRNRTYELIINMNRVQNREIIFMNLCNFIFKNSNFFKILFPPFLDNLKLFSR